MAKIISSLFFLLVSCVVHAGSDCEADLNGDGICDPYTVSHPAGDDTASKIVINIGGTDKKVTGDFELGDGGLAVGYIPGDFSLLIDFYTRNTDMTKYDFRWNPKLQDWVLYKRSTWVEPSRDEAYSLGGKIVPNAAKFPQQFDVQRVECCVSFSQFSGNGPTIKNLDESDRLSEIRADFKFIVEKLSLGEKGPLFYNAEKDGGQVKRNIPKDLVYEMTLILGQDNVGMINDYAYYLYRSGNSILAVLLLDEIHKKFPDRVVAILNLADAYWDIGMKEEACPLYANYIEKMTALGKSARIPLTAKPRAICK